MIYRMGRLARAIIPRPPITGTSLNWCRWGLLGLLAVPLKLGALPLEEGGAHLALPPEAQIQRWQIIQASDGPQLEVYRVWWPQPAPLSSAWWEGRLPEGWHALPLSAQRAWLGRPEGDHEQGWLAQWQPANEGVELWLSRLLKASQPHHSHSPRSSTRLPPALEVLSDWQVVAQGSVSRHRLLKNSRWTPQELMAYLHRTWAQAGWRPQAPAFSTALTVWERGSRRRHLVVVSLANGAAALISDHGPTIVGAKND